MACGCGDWDRLEASWTLDRCAALRRHWSEVAPPAHISLAALAGFRPRSAVRDGAGADDVIRDPDDLARQLRALGALG